MEFKTIQFAPPRTGPVVIGAGSDQKPVSFSQSEELPCKNIGVGRIKSLYPVQTHVLPLAQLKNIINNSGVSQHRYPAGIFYGFYGFFNIRTARRGIGWFPIGDIFFKSFLPGLNEPFAFHQICDMRPPVGMSGGCVKLIERNIHALLVEQGDNLFKPLNTAGAKILKLGQKYGVFQVQAVAKDMKIIVKRGAELYAVKIMDAELF